MLLCPFLLTRCISKRAIHFKENAFENKYLDYLQNTNKKIAMQTRDSMKTIAETRF